MAPDDPLFAVDVAAAESIPKETDLMAAVDSACSSPYITAPSSPKHPGSPSSSSNSPFSTAPPSPTPTHRLTISPNPAASEDDDDDFAFEFSGHLLDSAFLSAEELFDRGVIRPLRPLTRLQLSSQLAESTRERGGGPGPTTSKCAFAPRKFNFEYPMFESAAESTGRKETGKEPQIARHKSLRTSSFKGSSCSSCSSFKSCRKWRFRDLLSFRGGSGAPAVKRDGLGDQKTAGFGRSSGGEGSGSGRRGSGLDRRFERSGSEKTAAGELKRKGETTSCKQGFWECMRRFNHGEAHGLVKGVGNVSSRG